MPSCSRPSRTLRAADAVARRRAILDRHCARRHEARAGRGGRMVPIEQKDGTQEAADVVILRTERSEENSISALPLPTRCREHPARGRRCHYDELHGSHDLDPAGWG